MKSLRYTSEIQTIEFLHKEKDAAKAFNIITKRNLISAVFSKQPLVQLISDIITILTCFGIQYYLRFESGLFKSNINPDIFLIFLTAGVVLLYWLILFFFSGLYKNWYVRSPFDELFTIFKVSLFGCAVIAFFVLLDSGNSSREAAGTSPRLLFIFYFVIFAFLVSFGRTVSRRLQRKLKAKRIISVPVIIVGTSQKVLNLYENTNRISSWGYMPVGIVLTNENEGHNKLNYNDFNVSVPVWNYDSGFINILDKYQPQEVLISTENPKHNSLLEIVNACADKNISVKIEPDLYEIFTGQTRTQNIYGIPLIEISVQLLKPWEAILKRIFDIVFSFLVILAGIPVWLLTAILIKLESRGPAFYKQPRIGKDGKVFQIVKFRSMVTGADYKGQKWTSVNDPRVTKLGKFIRKTHLDETPQFWNVLKGEMSIVGPRPEQPQFVEEFSREIQYYKRRLKVRPGITGWWQVKYQAHVLDKNEILSRLKDDFFYIENMSLKLDIEIIIRTVWCVLSGHGQA